MVPMFISLKMYVFSFLLPVLSWSGSVWQCCYALCQWLPVWLTLKTKQTNYILWWMIDQQNWISMSTYPVNFKDKICSNFTTIVKLKPHSITLVEYKKTNWAQIDASEFFDYHKWIKRNIGVQPTCPGTTSSSQ